MKISFKQANMDPISLQTDRSHQTLETQIRLPREELCNEGLHFLCLRLHLLVALLCVETS